jgi:predicted TIM-barrel fold metal-dependent hydrolase
MMEANGISKAILSISSPGILLKPDDTAAAAVLARQCNSYMAKLKKDYPEKFGYYAHLPLPDVEASLKEIEATYAEGADGIIFLSNSAGLYPTDPRFARIWAELDKRKAVVFFHPAQPCLRCSDATLWPNQADEGSKPRVETNDTLPVIEKSNPFYGIYPAPMMEFLFETARVGATLFHFGVVQKYKNVTFHLPHVGGALPSLFSRIVGYSRFVKVPQMDQEPLTEEEAVALLNSRFYFDLAGWSFPSQWRMLIDGLGVKKERLLIGTDYCFTPAPAAAHFMQLVDGGIESWPGHERDLVYRENVKKMFGW